jgi:DNA-binding response OmpR family regulator
MTQVLLAEDDPAIAEPLARALTREGYNVNVQGTGQGAIDNASAADLVVLDLGLPDMDGLEVARAIRQKGLTTPVLVLAVNCI